MAQATIIIFPPAGAKFNAVNYSAKKEKNDKAQLLHFQNFGALELQGSITKKEFEKYLKAYSKRNEKVKNPVFHAALSAKGKEMSFEQLKDTAVELMNSLCYTDTPLLVYAHSDTDNNHVHIVTSRIGIDGKKINDSFEKKRAVQNLNQILNKDVAMEYTKAIDKAFGYTFSTAAQFLLLMEKQGFKARQKNNGIEFYKYGTVQGFIGEDKLKAKLNTSKPDAKTIKQIQALLYKYKNKYDTALQTGKSNPIDGSFKKHYSALTDFLKENFGLEFEFFTGKGKDMPYGYAVIDNKSKQVFKGSDVMSLESLLRLHSKQYTPETNASDNNHFSTNNTLNENSNQQEKTDNYQSPQGYTDIPELSPAPALPPKRLYDDEEEWKRKRKMRR